MKKHLSILLILVMLMTMLSVFTLPVLAVPRPEESPRVENGFTYSISNGVATIIDYAGSGTEIKIPTTLGGYPVVAIGSNVFEYHSEMTKVIIPDGVTSIGNSAFFDCTNLTSVSIPGSVKFIGEHAFYYCYDLTNISIPDGVTHISHAAFGGCSALSSIVIPASVTKIEEGAFSECDSLTDIFYGGTENRWYDDVELGINNTPLLMATVHFNNKESSISVYDGSADKASAVSGTPVTVTANVPAGYVFDQWIATGVTLSNVYASTVQFVMPACAVSLTATFKAIEVTTTAPTVQPTTQITEPSASSSVHVITSPQKIIYGDATDDGVVNMKDVLSMRKYVADIPTVINLVTADTNGDGIVNMKDVLTVRKYIAGIILEITGTGNDPTSPTKAPTTSTNVTTNPTGGTEPTSGTYPTSGTNPTGGTEPTSGTYPTSGTNPTSGSEPTSAPTTVCYPKNALLEKQVEHNTDGSVSGWEEYTYDEYGNKMSQRSYNADGNVYWGNSWDATYDANGNQTSYREYEFKTCFDWNEAWDATYDAKGNIRSYRKYRSIGDVSSGKGQVYYDAFYDVDGKEVAKNYYNEDGSVNETRGEWFTRNIDGTVTVYRRSRGDRVVSYVSEKSTYDENGNYTSRRQYTESGNIDWTGSWDYAYDENGNWTRECYYDEYGGKWVCHESSYDENSNQTSCRYYNPDGSVDWESNHTWDAVYDSNGNQTSKRHYKELGKVDWEDGNTWDATYDSNGNILTKTYYGYGGRVSWWYEYTYDRNGDLASIYYYDNDGQTWCSCISTYDSNGNKTSYREYDIGSYEIESSSRDYVYDECGNRLKEIAYQAGRPYVLWEGTYNANNVLIGERYCQSDDNIDYECVYDENGNQISYRKYTYYGTLDWVSCYDTTYDASGNLLTKTYFNKDGNVRYWDEYIYLNQSAPEKEKTI